MSDDETSRKFAALSEAICDVLADVTADNVVLRKLLSAKRLVPDSEFEQMLKSLRQTGAWLQYRDQIQKRVRDIAKAKFESMGGSVN
jgi:hypothetical protein